MLPFCLVNRDGMWDCCIWFSYNLLLYLYHIPEPTSALHVLIYYQLPEPTLSIPLTISYQTLRSHEEARPRLRGHERFQTSNRSSIPTTVHQFMIYSTSARQGRYIPDLYDLDHTDGWKRYHTHGASTCFLCWICTTQVLHSTPQPQVTF